LRCAGSRWSVLFQCDDSGGCGSHVTRWHVQNSQFRLRPVWQRHGRNGSNLVCMSCAHLVSHVLTCLCWKSVHQLRGNARECVSIPWGGVFACHAGSSVYPRPQHACILYGHGYRSANGWNSWQPGPLWLLWSVAFVWFDCFPHREAFPPECDGYRGFWRYLRAVQYFLKVGNTFGFNLPPETLALLGCGYVAACVFQGVFCSLLPLLQWYCDETGATAPLATRV
jgi:hypothetical protein